MLIHINPATGQKTLTKILAYYLVLVLFSLILLPGTIVLFNVKTNSTKVIAHEELSSVKSLKKTNEAVKNESPKNSLLGKSDLLIDKIMVYRSDYGVTESLDFETYVKGVVASEMPAHFEMEALKAQAVAARTYSLSRVIRAGDGGNPSHPSAALCDSTHCQVYRSEAELESINGSQWIESSWPRVKEAVESTSGQLMFYDGELVAQAMFHSTSGGKTENSEDVFVAAVPYLRSVESPYEEGSPHYKTRYGHGVGMSQWGANGMASEGYDYKKILSHYYTGIELR